MRVLLAGWITLLAAMALWARPVAEALQLRGWLTGAGVLALGLVGVLCLRVLGDRDGDQHPLVPWVPLVLTAVAAGWLAGYWRLPQERVHLVQYLPLGVIAWRALGGRVAAALLLCLAVGAGDELLQGSLPDRRFDPWDVVANAIASTAGVLLARGGRTSWAAVALLVAARLVLPVLHEGHPGVTGQPPAQEPSADAAYPGASVLLITIDALRLDHAPPWGDPGVPTPALARLAAESVTFEGAANGIWTTPSMVSLLSGLLPPVHGVQARGLELAPGMRTPLELLARSGWTTVGHFADDMETYRHLGFDRSSPDGVAPEQAVADLLAAEGPAFVWVHLTQVHAPYDATPERLLELGLSGDLPEAPLLDRARGHYTVPRADFPGAHDGLREPLRRLYAAEVADADAALARILERLERDGLTDDLLLVLTADHGEELLERGGVGHASTTLDSAPQPELISIPMYLRMPDGAMAGRRVPGRFEQVDLMPTLLPLLGLRALEPLPGVPLDGRDLSASVLRGEPVPPRDLLVSSCPCGWQCPQERRGERVHSLVSPDGEWTTCREPDPCAAPLVEALGQARERGERLGSPVASPL